MRRSPSNCNLRDSPRPHRPYVGFQGFLQHGLAEFRILLPHGEGAVHHAGVAHGVPVVLVAVEPGVGLVPGGFEAFVDDRPGDGLPFGRRHPVVQPVVADGEGHRHLADIQEMRRVPVRERAGGQHLVDGPPRIRLPAHTPPRHGPGTCIRARMCVSGRSGRCAGAGGRSWSVPRAAASASSG